MLVIDDDRSLREALEIVFQIEGYAVATAGEGQQALDRLRQGLAPCVILLDLAMPVKNGWQFRSEQIQDPNLARIPVIVCSGTDGVDPQGRAPLAVEHLLRKPVAFDELLGLVEHYCGQEQARGRGLL